MAKVKRQKLDLRSLFKEEDILISSTAECVLLVPHFKFNTKNYTVLNEIEANLVVKNECLAITTEPLPADRKLFDFTDKPVPRYMKRYTTLPQTTPPVFKSGHVHIESQGLTCAEFKNIFLKFNEVTVFAKNNIIIIKILHE